MLPRSARAALLFALLALAAGAGFVRPGGEPWALGADDPLRLLNSRLREATGGDDVLVVTLGPSDELLTPRGVAAIEAVTAALAASPAVERVLSVSRAVQPREVAGALTAWSPLSPPPQSEAGWAEAREALLADPFTASLVDREGRTAAVYAWLRRLEPGPALAKVLSRPVDWGGLEAGLRPPDPVAAQAAVNAFVSEVRLAVVLGQEPGPPDAALVRRLEGEGAPEAIRALRPALASIAERLVDDPEDVARAAVLEVDEDLRREILGPEAERRAVAARAQRGWAGWMAALALAGALVGLLTGQRQLVVAGLLGALLGGAAVGAGAWLGVAPGFPGIAAAGALAAVGLLGRPPVPLPLLIGFGAAFVGAAEQALLPASAWSLAATGLLLVPRRAVGRRPRLPALVAVLVAAAAVGTTALLIRPGADAAALVASEHRNPALRLLAERLGAAPPAFLVGSSDEPGGQARVAAVTALAEAQAALRQEGIVTVGWPDLLSSLHERVADAEPGSLPPEDALIEQYLMVFGKPDAVAALASPSRDLALATVLPGEGGGRRLADLAERWPAGGSGPALAGDSVLLAVSARRAWMRVLPVALVALLLGLALVPRDGGAALLGGAAAAAVAAGTIGTLTPTVLAAGLVGAAAAGASRPAQVALLLAAGARWLGPTALTGFCDGAAAAALVGLLAVDPAGQTGRGTRSPEVP